MFHNYSEKNYSKTISTRSSLKRMEGALLPVAIFIIVIMSLLAVTMNRLLVDASRSTIADVYGARATLAARSGAEILLSQIFPGRIDEFSEFPAHSGICTDRTVTPVNNAGATPIAFTEEGLSGCSVRVACDYLLLEPPYGREAPQESLNFRILSTSSCNIGNSTYSKELVLEATHGAL